jgi:hypothetical protein
MIAFYAALALAVAAAAAYAMKREASAWLGYAVAATGATAFAAAIAGLLSFLSLYIYEHPHHHCPFCILKPDYDYRGYWLYLPLFGATAAALACGALQPFRRIASLRTLLPSVARKLAAVAAALFALFALVASAMIGLSNLILLEG